jgi:hypothetical protein
MSKLFVAKLRMKGTKWWRPNFPFDIELFYAFTEKYFYFFSSETRKERGGGGRKL